MEVNITHRMFQFPRAIFTQLFQADFMVGLPSNELHHLSPRFTHILDEASEARRDDPEAIVSFQQDQPIV